LLWLSACLIATQFAGCATTESWRTSNNNSIRSAKSKSKPLETADSDTEDEDEEDRLKYVGSDGRADLARDEPLDPWFGKYNYAEKGRAIERNLGQ
jgi:hypothetical protein